MNENGKFLVMSSDEFKAWLDSETVDRTIKVIQNHHTYIPAYKDFTNSNHFALLKGMEKSHIVDRGFSEIAQNLTIFPDGMVAVCRALSKIPAGIKGANQYGICIENLGNFDAGMDSMTSLQSAAIVSVNAALCVKFHLNPGTKSIVYHHWYDLITCLRTDGKGTTKTCPGTAFFGGNSVEQCNTNFIPQIAVSME